MLEIKKASVTSKEAQLLLQELNGILFQMTGSSGTASFDFEEMKNPRAVFVIAYENQVPVGCGAIRELTEEQAEIKRVYVRPNHRGVGHAIIESLEQMARTLDYRQLVLETRSVNTKAIHFYLKCGYKEGPNYGKYVGRKDAICFFKQLEA